MFAAWRRDALRLDLVPRATAITVLGLFLHVVLVLASPTSRVVTLVPDDAFYYLVLAKNHARAGVWTFDGGLTTTTGFHLLHAWVCSLVYRLAPGLGARAALDVHLVLGGVLTAAASVLFVRAVARVGPRPAQLAVPIVLLSGGALGCAMQVMEWPWVVFASAVGLHAVVAGRPLVAVAAGVAGTLARSDFPLAAVCIGGAVLVPALGGERRTRAAGVAYAVGAIVGLAIVLAHTHALSGELFQASARMKSQWAKTTGYDVLPGLDAIALVTPLGFSMLRSLDWGTITFVVVALPLFGVVCVRSLARSDDARPGLPRWLVASAAATVVGYVVVYGWNSAAAQAWYSADVVAAIVVLVAAGIARASERSRKIGLALAAVLVVANVALARVPPYRGQAVAREAAAVLGTASAGARLGAWNAGTYSYFSGVPIVNLDGLVNDEIYPYAASGRLACYVHEKKIEMIVDAEGMLAPELARRGGYADGTLAKALHGQRLLANEACTIMLWRVDDAVLAAACER